MALTVETAIRGVSGISHEDDIRIRAFLQGLVYSWVKNRPGETFAARDLVGGENGNWAGTPLQVLYEKHIEQGKDPDAASEVAGQDLGWLLKRVLNDDKREFEQSRLGQVSGYTWTGKEA